MKQQWRYFLVALMFFTRIPVRIEAFQESDLNHASRFFPLIGILVGAFAAIVYWLASQLVPQEIAVIASMISSILLTGAFHEDGLADAVDGLGGGLGKEQVLTIMQDSRIGSYGAIALVLTLLLKFQVLIHITPVFLPLIMVAAHALSRFAAVLVMFTQPYVRPQGKSKPLATQLSTSELMQAALFGLAPLLLLPPRYLLALVAVAILWAWFSLTLKKRLGGYTGDCLGAMQQLTEITFYLSFLVCSSI